MKNEPTGGVNTLSYLKQSKMIFLCSRCAKLRREAVCFKSQDFMQTILYIKI